MMIAKRALFVLLCMVTILACTSPNPQAIAPATIQPSTIECVVEIGESDSLNVSHSRRLRGVAEDSRAASVKVYSMDRLVRGSGSYFNLNGHDIIITAAHVVRNMPLVEIVTHAGESQIAVVAYSELEENRDYAVLLLVEPLETVTAMDLEILRSYDDLIGESVVYTGYPAHHERLTIFGTIANIEQGHVVMQSYAWPGASGSIIFDDRGRVIGVLRAIDINRTPWGPQLTEDVVWMHPMKDLDLDKISKFLDVYEVLVEEEVRE